MGSEKLMRLVAGAAALAFAVAGAGGVVLARSDTQPKPPAAESVQRPHQAAPQEQGPPNRRELLMRLATLAGVSPEAFRRAVRDHGGVRPALESFGVDEAMLLDSLTAMIRPRYDPAVNERRLSPEQADQLAHRQARRLLRRLG